MRKIFPLVVVALLAAGSAAAQTARSSQPRDLGSRERTLLLNAPSQRPGGIERSRALQLAQGAPAGLGSTERRHALRAVCVAGTRVSSSATQGSLGAVERTTLLRRGPTHLQPARRRPAFSR